MQHRLGTSPAALAGENVAARRFLVALCLLAVGIRASVGLALLTSTSSSPMTA